MRVVDFEIQAIIHGLEFAFRESELL